MSIMTNPNTQRIFSVMRWITYLRLLINLSLISLTIQKFHTLCSVTLNCELQPLNCNLIGQNVGDLCSHDVLTYVHSHTHTQIRHYNRKQNLNIFYSKRALLTCSGLLKSDSLIHYLPICHQKHAHAAQTGWNSNSLLCPIVKTNYPV